MDPAWNKQQNNLSSIPDTLITNTDDAQVSDDAQYRNLLPLPVSLEKYRAYLPSKRIMMAFGAIVIIALGYIIIPKIPTMFLQIKNIFTHKTSLPVSKTPISTAQTDKDSDSDGIPDWQEALFNLDPSDPDSDNDGNPDSVPADLQNLAENPDIVNQQDKLILGIIAELDKEGGYDNLSETQISEKVQTEILKAAESIESGFTIYTEKDITLTDNSSASINTYKSTMTPIFKRVKPTTDIARKLYSVVSLNDKVQYPAAYMTTLKNTTQQMLKTPTPRNISSDHLKLLNAISLLHDFTDSMHNDKQMYENTDSYIKMLIIQKNINGIFKSIGNSEVFFSINQ